MQIYYLLKKKEPRWRLLVIFQFTWPFFFTMFSGSFQHLQISSCYWSQLINVLLILWCKLLHRFPFWANEMSGCYIANEAVKVQDLRDQQILVVKYYISFIFMHFLVWKFGWFNASFNLVVYSLLKEPFVVLLL